MNVNTEVLKTVGKALLSAAKNSKGKNVITGILSFGTGAAIIAAVDHKQKSKLKAEAEHSRNIAERAVKAGEQLLKENADLHNSTKK